jgi:4-amino-4-deoxychorismate lyase
METYLINGEFEAGVSPYDRGLSFGDGVFRTFTVSNGVPNHWEAQYQKLYDDCQALKLKCPFSQIILEDIVKLFPKDTTLKVAKVIITRGNSMRGYAVPQNISPNRVLIKSSLPNYPNNYFEQGVNLQVFSIRLSSQPLLAGVKHLNRLENVLARMEIVDSEMYDGVLLDENNHVIECSNANIFARFNSQLITPSLTKCGVSGVTRQRIISIAQLLGLSVAQESCTLESFNSADEVFICNSVFGAFNVKAIGQTTFSNYGLAAKLREMLNT